MKLVAMLLLLLTTEALAQSTNQTQKYHRPAVASELAGFWKMVKWTAYFKIEEKDKNTPFFRDYQWYLFAEDGSLKSLSSTRDSSPKEAFDALQQAPSVIRFKMESDLLKTTRTDMPEVKETWSCSLITEERKQNGKTPALKKGDMLMSLLNKDGKVIYVRHLRKADPSSTEPPVPAPKPAAAPGNS